MTKATILNNCWWLVPKYYIS